MIDTSKMKRTLTMYCVLLVVLISNYLLIGNKANLRAVEFIRIFAMGGLFGAIISIFSFLNKLKKNNEDKE